MILALNAYDVDKANVIIGDKVTNLVGDYNFFYKLCYSTGSYIMNGIFIKINLLDYKSKVYYNYIKIHYNIEKNRHLINTICEIENYILSNMTTCVKHNLYNELMHSAIKIQKKNYDNNEKHIILKITGIWENNNSCGLCYKFLIR